MKRIILEGTDAVGKSTARALLKEVGIAVEDRSREYISKYMLFDVDMPTRVGKYEEFFRNNDVLVIFMVNFDADEIMRRVYSRERVSEFDKRANEYNELYYNTYLYMMERGIATDSLFLADCTSLAREQTLALLKDIIEKQTINTLRL